MLIVILILMLATFAVSFLTLSAVGHLHLKAQALQAQVTAVFRETQFQSRITRKALLDTLNEKVLPAVGYKEPEPTELETAMGALSRGEEPVLDWSRFKLQGKP
ncbi:MAG: hypothetical protein HY010_13145 [Acidobacteria bacterium]|nr:hypothetical protein [Acidobacteriota bacterium]